MVPQLLNRLTDENPVVALRAVGALVAIGDRLVETVDDVHRRLVAWPIGEALTLTIVRGAERREVGVTPVETP